MERMFKRHAVLRSATGVAAIAVCLSLSGCYSMYEGKAVKQIAKAQDWGADKWKETVDGFNSAKKALDAAHAAAQAGQSSEAKTQAQSAATLSEQAMNGARTRYADESLKQAETDMKVASINDGQSQNANLFNDAQKNLNAARDKYQKQKYEDTINLAKQVTTQVDQLLASLRNSSENRLTELNRKLTDLKTAKAEQYFPQPLLHGNEATVRIKEKIEKDRDYKQAIILAGSAISEVEQGIIEAKKRNSEDELRNVEDKIAEAIAEEAPIHVPDALKNVQDRFESILAGFYEKQYDTVLDETRALKPRVDQLIVMARIEATKDRIRLVNEGITKLREQNVEQYLPGRIKVMEDLQSKAQDEFNNANYQGAKFQASNALVEQDRIVAAFDALAERTIQEASGSVASADKTYARMGQIFGTRGTEVDPRMASRFQLTSSDLNTKLINAKEALAFAGTSRSSKEFRKAIERAKDANATADTVSAGTYRLVSENALLGIQDQISILERQGARDYASRQLGEVQGLVDRTQKMLAENHPREAAESAAKTRAYLENVKQELARRAGEEANRSDQMLQRLEGGAAATPASGGVVMGRQFPGGADESNAETASASNFADFGKDIVLISASDADQLSHNEPIQLCQTRVGNPTNSSGYTGEAGFLDNRNINSGTYMTNQTPNSVFLRTGAPTGAIIGTRPEPVVPTSEATGAYTGGTEGSYEAPTGPGPFVARAAIEGGAAAPTVVAMAGTGSGAPTGAEADGVSAIRQRIDDILLDDQRARDIQEFAPDAIERARGRLAESAAALQAQDYVRATELARDAQRIVIEADQRAAKRATDRNLQDAADRINLAQGSGSIMFAPAELNEAVRLYESARALAKTGDFTQARQVSARAVVAADDARLYNVNKARDLSALSTRYGGYKASHPALTEAVRAADISEHLLDNPATAAQGQEVAKQAVALAQVALDAARDYTFQERLDNIYKALNTALRAGANYFNVQEIKRLMAELSVARDEYCTRNFDAVELKLKDIEARLSRVIETTPLVLEENLIETTEKLNALVLAGAENWMAQEVDDVKSLMNRSVIDFRKHDYYSSYTNIRNAMQLTERIEKRLQEQVYYDSVTELFAQLDRCFVDFQQILNFDRVFMKKLVTTPQGQPAAINWTGKNSPNDFRDRVNDIYLRAIHLKPPQSQEGTHNEVITAIKFAKVAAENFQKLYIMDQLSTPDAYNVIDTAYNQISRARTLRSEIQVRMIEPEARTKVIRAEKIVNF